MAGTTESCSICGATFEIQFRYQMEEKPGGFVLYCSQACLKASQTDGNNGKVRCDACGKPFCVELVTNVFYVNGLRRYACSMQCRAQLASQGHGARPADSPAKAVEDNVPVRPASQKLEEEKLNTPPRPRRDRSASFSHPVVIAVFNHKGGTGKTTTSVNLAAGLARRNRRVLLVDTDAQGNVAVSLNLKVEKTLYHVLVTGVPVGEAVVQARDGLDVLASNETLAAAELYLAGRQSRERVLAGRLESARLCYDVIVVDCSPSLSLMNQNALVLADTVLVPVACDYLSLVGVRQVIRTIKNVNQHLRHPVQICGVLPTFYDARARVCRDAFETLKQHFGSRCLLPIRATMKVKEAPALGQTIFEHAPTSHAAEDYGRLVDAFVREPEYGAAVSA